jgi:hypothetical protein
MRFFTLSLISLASASPALLTRQSDDFGFWNATIGYESIQSKTAGDITARYYKGALQSTVKCNWTESIEAVVTSQCKDDQGRSMNGRFSYFTGLISKSAANFCRFE